MLLLRLEQITHYPFSNAREGAFFIFIVFVSTTTFDHVSPRSRPHYRLLHQSPLLPSSASMLVRSASIAGHAPMRQRSQLAE